MYEPGRVARVGRGTGLTRRGQCSSVLQQANGWPAVRAVRLVVVWRANSRAEGVVNVSRMPAATMSVSN